MYGKGTLAIATGVGKSKIFIDTCKKVLARNPKARIALIVPTEKLRDENWKDEFTKWANEDLYNCIERYCYASINKITKTFDFIGADEVHNITELNSKFFELNKNSEVMGLTATPPEDELKSQLMKRYCPVIFEYTLQEAVLDGLVVPFNIKIIELPLDDKDKYIEVKTKSIQFKTTEKAYYEFLNKQINQARYSRNKQLEKFRILNRMRFLYNLKSKTELAKKLIASLAHKKTLIFCGTIAQAEELCKNTYHSRSGDKDYLDFIHGDINHLSCVRALNEGMNIPELDAAIIVQGSAKKREIIQRIGRCVRWREDHVAEIYIINSMGTQDVSWTQNALEGLSSNIEYIHYKNI